MPDLPDALERLVLAMLEKDPADRPPDFTSPVDALRRLGADRGC